MFKIAYLKVAFYCSFFLVLVIACSFNETLFRKGNVLGHERPEGFPVVDYPADNTFTKERWLLGKKLFYDKSFSVDYSTSCASCHQLPLAFSDRVAFSKGAENKDGTRNAPTLANVAYHPYYIRDGGVPTLEMQILVPIQEHNEFNFNILEIAKRLQNNPDYKALSKKAYGRELDFYVITRAIANFERTLISGESKYDHFKSGKKKAKFNESETRGMALFFSEKTNCSTCHSGFNFTNYKFENNGLHEHYNDIGRKRLTLDDKDLEKFKTPTLRNIVLTSPYMHDGSIKTLEEVIEHYNSGGKLNPRKSEKIKKLNLTKEEKTDLLNFLRTLTDRQFITNKNYLPK
jgi:cytochrome c peroxidase